MSLKSFPFTEHSGRAAHPPNNVLFGIRNRTGSSLFLSCQTWHGKILRIVFSYPTGAIVSTHLVLPVIGLESISTSSLSLGCFSL